VIPPVSRKVLKAEVDSLPKDQFLPCHKKMFVFWAESLQIPFLFLREVGSLTEETFREV
jgi:hypothetical protein